MQVFIYILMNGKMLEKHTKQKNNFKKQIKKKPTQTKLSLQFFLMVNFDRVNGPIDMRVWKGSRFEIKPPKNSLV